MNGKAAGVWLMILGVGHCLVGFYWHTDLALAILRDGLLWNAVDAAPERQMLFWFQIVSPLLFLLGWVLYLIAPREVPASVGWGLLATTLVGCFLKPVSGLWFLLVPTVLLLRKRRVVTGRPVP